MKKIFWLLPFLAGCAITPERALQMSSFDLCKAVHQNAPSSADHQAAARELQLRRQDCKELAAYAPYQPPPPDPTALLLFGASMLNQAHQPPAVVQPPPAPIRCFSTRTNIGYNTVCR